MKARFYFDVEFKASRETDAEGIASAMDNVVKCGMSALGDCWSDYGGEPKVGEVFVLNTEATTGHAGGGGKKGSSVAYNHLTVYYEPGFINKPYGVNVDNPDNPDGTRNPGDEGHRFATPKEAGKFVTGWLAGRQKEPKGTAIVQVAIEGLVEHYPQLKRKSVADAVRKQVKVPDTGNDQADYQNVRNQIEFILNKQRM